MSNPSEQPDLVCAACGGSGIVYDTFGMLFPCYQQCPVDIIEVVKQLEDTIAQMELAGDCIERGCYDEALLHCRSMHRTRRALIAICRHQRGSTHA